MQTTMQENIIRLKVEIKNNPAPPPQKKKENILAH